MAFAVASVGFGIGGDCETAILPDQRRAARRLSPLAQSGTVLCESMRPSQDFSTDAFPATAATTTLDHEADISRVQDRLAGVAQKNHGLEGA